MSFTMVAPASSAASATSRLRVSIDTRTWPARAPTTGTTLPSSSSTGTSAAPGRVLSPPTSTTSAPSATSSSPWATAASGSSQRPPSENESGVTLSTPITSGRNSLGPVDEVHRLAARGLRLAKQAPHRRGDRERSRLPHPSHRHAQVLGLDDDKDAPRFQRVVDLVGDLGGEPLLYLRASCVGLDEPDQLRQARDAPVLVGDVGDMCLAEERREVVLAGRRDRDVLDHDHLVVTGLEGDGEVLVGRVVQTAEDLLVHVRDALGRAAQSVAVGFLADRLEDLADGLLDAALVDGIHRALGAR